MTWFRFPCQRCGAHFKSHIIRDTCERCERADCRIYPMPIRGQASGC
jgi:hypothetical protein